MFSSPRLSKQPATETTLRADAKAKGNGETEEPPEQRLDPGPEKGPATDAESETRNESHREEGIRDQLGIAKNGGIDATHGGTSALLSDADPIRWNGRAG